MERTAYLHQTLLEINSHLRIFPGKFINFFSIFPFFISFVQLLDGRENGHQMSYDLKLTYYPITLPNPQSTSNTSLARYSKRKLSWLSDFSCHFVTSIPINFVQLPEDIILYAFFFILFCWPPVSLLVYT